MKHRSAAWSLSERALQALSWLLLLLAGLLTISPAAQAGAGPVEIRSAHYLVSDAAEIPEADAAWRAVTLPHREARHTDAELTPYWYKVEFDAAAGPQPMWAYFPKLRSGGKIYLNGIQIENVRSADRTHQVRWFRPHLFFLPPSVLKHGRNELAVRFAIREPLTSFGEIYVGTEDVLRPVFERNQLWEDTSVKMTSAACILAGTLILVFWLRRRQEVLYGLFGACVLFWGIRTLVFRMVEVPMEFWMLWRFAYYVSTFGFIVCITLFLLRFSQAQNRWLTRILVGLWLAGPALFLAAGTALRPFMDAWWTLFFLPFTVYAVARMCMFVARRPSGSGMAMVLAILFALLLSLHDYAVQHGMFGLSEYYLLHLGIPVYLLVMACVLLDRFIVSLRGVESANEQLARQLAQRESELTASHECLRKLERERAVADERKRIVQDMHDGVGSQLLTTLVLAQRGATAPANVVPLLQGCLDDMRLAIDSLTPDDPDLLSVLGNLRFRMEARFADMGIALVWRNHDMPEALELEPRTILQLVRMMQEALANILKHARATQARVDIRFSPSDICIDIADDGIGFSAPQHHAGHGLGNMASRAQAIGASFRITGDGGTGTAVSIVLPLEASDTLGDASDAAAGQYHMPPA